MRCASSVGLRCERITCIHCGLIRELAPEHGQDFELWYRASVRGHTVWAKTRQSLDFLVAWMTGAVDERDLRAADRRTRDGTPRAAAIPGMSCATLRR
ncbi:MAG: hypothetical protein JNK64_16375 [Myxococcales bacterium]|nr:hypothetical protein [Myxococcales bacterium]